MLEACYRTWVASLSIGRRMALVDHCDAGIVSIPILRIVASLPMDSTSIFRYVNPCTAQLQHYMRSVRIVSSFRRRSYLGNVVHIMARLHRELEVRSLALT